MSFEKIFNKINELNFHLAGVCTPAVPERDETGLKEWLKKGYAGEMNYMHRHFEKCIAPEKILPGVQSIIVLGVNYKPPITRNEKKYTLPGKISSYARGLDYHRVLKTPLRELCGFIEKEYPEEKAAWYTDTGAVMEKAHAVSAGLGFIGKNTLLITDDYGSWVFLSAVLTTLKLPPSTAKQKDCGSCNLCIDACPVDALVEPYILNSRKCISYLTIEHRGELPAGTNLHGWIFGCDTCQEVCPHNYDTPVTTWTEFYPDRGAGAYIECLPFSTDELPENFNTTPLRRTGIDRLERNSSKLYRHGAGLPGTSSGKN